MLDRECASRTERRSENETSIVRWFVSILASPVVASDGDYFERLERSSALSAPVASSW